jgi:shikimate dehydrogenase
MKKFLVIGNPINHSLSPKLHNYWIKKNNIKAVYDKQKLNENDLKNIIFQLREKKINGINVTVPFKKIVIPFLDELTADANKTKSVNTIYLNNNRLIGDNTDIIGFQKSVDDFKYDLNNKEVFILGAWRCGSINSFCFNQNESFKNNNK